MNLEGMKKSSMIGMSIAASWAWGTSLIMGMQIAQTKGIIAFCIWAMANCLTLVLFAGLYKYIQSPMIESKVFKFFALAVQIFCLIIQMNVINQIVGNYIITCIIGVIFIVIVFKNGILICIGADVIEWVITIGAIITIVIIGYATGAERIFNYNTEWSNIRWGMYSALVLFSGPIGDLQHHQRARINVRGYVAGALYFFMYMCLVFYMSTFKFNGAMNILLLVATLCVTTSTIDSIAVSLHELCNKYVGTAVGIFICFAWTIFVDIGIIEIWSKFGFVRIAFAVALVVVGLYQNSKKRKNKYVINLNQKGKR